MALAEMELFDPYSDTVKERKQKKSFAYYLTAITFSILADHETYYIERKLLRKKAVHCYERAFEVRMNIAYMS
jgi:hypothetical protein